MIGNQNKWFLVAIFGTAVMGFIAVSFAEGPKERRALTGCGVHYYDMDKCCLPSIDETTLKFGILCYNSSLSRCPAPNTFCIDKDLPKLPLQVTCKACKICPVCPPQQKIVCKIEKSFFDQVVACLSIAVGISISCNCYCGYKRYTSIRR